MTQTQAYSQDRAQALVAAFMRSVYNWMIIGLAVTGAVAWMTASSETLMKTLVSNPLLFLVLMAAEFGLVLVLASRAARLKPSTAAALFLVYSALTGVTFSVILLAYAKATIYSAFFVSAGAFAGMSFYGYTTQKDLTSWGSFLFMGLIGLVIASVVNIFLASSVIEWILPYVGVVVFVGLTAYDTQKLKNLAMHGLTSGESARSLAVAGALSLYLDFINLFLMLLMIFGRGRD